MRGYEDTAGQGAELWRAVIDALPHALAVLGPRGEHLAVNAAFCRMTGFSYEELVGCGPPYAYCGGDDAARMDALVLATDDGPTQEAELAFRSKHGESFAVLVQGSPLAGDGVRAACRIISVRHATEHDRAQRKLHESEKRLQLALAAAEMGTFDIDFSRGTTVCSPRAHAIYGYEPGKGDMPQSLERFFEHLHPEDALRVKQAVRANLQNGSLAPFEVEYRLRQASGEYVWIHSRARRLVEPDGTTHVWGFLTDISARKQLELAQERLDAQLRHAQKMDTLGALAAGIAHDFNNLVLPILGTAEHLLRSEWESPATREGLANIVSAAQRAKDVASRILLFGRRADPTHQAVLVIADLVREALQLVAVSLPPSIRLRSHIDEDCGAVYGSPDEILQAITNLLMNAYQSLRISGGQLSVHVRRVRVDKGCEGLHGIKHDSAVQIVVEDDGPGMPPEVLARIFEPFFTTKPAGDGSGLGLAMVQAVATRHGGAVLVHSRPGEGARFELYLPLHTSSPSTSEDLIKPLPIPTQGRRRSHVICVDDEHAVLKTFELIISHAGHQVTLFSSPADALHWLQANPDEADLVITDQSMPQLTGLELADRLYELAPSVPVILISGYNDVGADEKPRPNVRLNLCKPVGYDTLLHAVQASLAPEVGSTASD